MASKALRYYYDFMSQPSRSLWIALKLSKIPFEDCPVALRKLEHRTEEYKKINRFQKVPCIVDGDFHLSESVAILRYLADKGQFSQALYPKEIKERARVDEFLEWHHLTLRCSCAMHFWHLWLMPVNGLAPEPSEKKREKLQNEMETNLKILDEIWLKNTKFVAGNKLSIADIFGASEIEQTRLSKYNAGEHFPRIGEWLQNVRQESNPFYEEAHKFIYKKSGATS